mmetsp:Transcript_5133/g.12342  ORF Transcript_5133/g.12342 Transcript_5133/m.12342 type:complete len:376 (+) Transcript_5133:233-1360(+)
MFDGQQMRNPERDTMRMENSSTFYVPRSGSPTSEDRPGTAMSSLSRPNTGTSRGGGSYSTGLLMPTPQGAYGAQSTRSSHQPYQHPGLDLSWDRPQTPTVRRKAALMYSNMADKMSIQEARSTRRHGWHMEEAELDIVHIMTYMRQRVTNASLFLVEFFRDFDPARRGYTSAYIFLRGVDMARCFTDMSKNELRLVVRMFTEPRPQQFKDHNCNYAAFCELLQPCDDSRVQMTPEYQRLRDALEQFTPEMSLDSPYATQALSDEGEIRVSYLKKKLQHKIISTRVSARELLGDYDPHLNGGTVGWMKKTCKHTQFLCNIPGCVSRSQYMRGMVRLAGDLGLTDADMDLLYSKYERNGAFNYFAFCKDMDITSAEH